MFEETRGRAEGERMGVKPNLRSARENRTRLDRCHHRRRIKLGDEEKVGVAIGWG